ncbi:MAG TPA: hypothetical protein HA257_04910 [Candidatus Methanoperedenaceae archaeon]|nr:hypothetical protein [Candidatus Methanoperedenaceae archaeon]
MVMIKAAYKILVLGIILSLIYSPTFPLPLIAIFEGFALALFLAWFMSKLDLKPESAFALIWLSLLMIGGFNNMLEGYFFTKIYSSIALFTNQMLKSLFMTMLESASAVLLLQPHGSMGVLAALRNHLASRSRSSWVKRMVIASAAFFPVYFIFGAIVSPFVIPFYSRASSGLVIPPIQTILALELGRGFIYTAVLLVVFAGLKGDRKLDFRVAFALLYIPGALLPLVSSMVELSVISQVAPYHMVELLADSGVYGFIAARLLGAGK